MNPDPTNNTPWDYAIIGAGPAGSIAAALLATRGHRRTILIEKSSWPREKVCGGCLTSHATTILRDLNISLHNTQPLHSVVWHAAHRSLRLDLPGEIAILRSDLDAQLVAEATRRGCHFLSATTATLEPSSPADLFRTIRLQSATESTTIRAHVVLAADGINGTFLASEPWAAWTFSPNAYFGVATTCSDLSLDIPPGEIHMHVGNAGYVGLVRINETQMHLAAALDPTAAKRAAGPANLIRKILTSSPAPDTPGEGRGGGRIDEWHPHKLRGTPPLTRHRKTLGGHRVLAIGDACGYVEPFTGEGIAWAIAGAREVVNLLPNPADPWPANLPTLWQKRHHQLIAGKQRWCWAMRPMMRHPEFAPLIFAVANAVPAITRWIATRISQPRPDRFNHAAPQGVTQ